MLKAPTSEPGFFWCALIECLMPVWLKSFCHSIFAVTHLAAIWLNLQLGKFQKKSAKTTVMQSATANQEVDMVAQRYGGPTAISPALQLAVPDDVDSSTRSPDKKVEPESKRGRSAGPPRVQKRQASEIVRGTSRRSVWIGSPAQEPRPPDSPFSPLKKNLGDPSMTPEYIHAQMDSDRRHTKELQEAISLMDLTQQNHADFILTHNKIHETLQASVDGLTDRMRGVEATCGAGTPDSALRQEHEFLKARLAQVERFVEIHEERENQMAKYLEKLDALLPMEGQTVVRAFKDIEKDLDDLKTQSRHIAENYESFRQHTSASADKGPPAGTTEAMKQGFQVVQLQINDLRNEFANMTAARMSGGNGCHCEHVEGHDMWLHSLDDQVQTLTQRAIPRTAPAPPT